MGCGCKERRARIAREAKKTVKKVSTRLEDIMKKIYGEQKDA